MKKQKLETIFRKSLNNHKYRLWFQKLQVHPLAHCNTPADFIILSEDFKYLVECKQTNCKYVDKAFNFDRLTQKEDLIYFENKHIRNKSYILFLFLKETLKKSYIYLVPLHIYLEMEREINKKSANLKDFKKHCDIFRVEVIKGSLFNLDSLFL